MKKKILPIITIITTILLLVSLLQNLKLNSTLKEANHNTINNSTHNYISKTYDCSFTVTYRVVNLLEDYIYDDPTYSYIVVDKFQQHNPISHYLPSNLKETLEPNKYYEFTYHIKGNGHIEDIHDIINNIHTNHLDNEKLSVTLSIKETDKLGLDQIQENICN